jgi:peptide-methionine (S)-S-oxide reductase
VNPTYYALGDHTETVDIDYDPQQTNYAELLDIFWNNHNPCTKNKKQYMSVIFYHDTEQKEMALRTKEEMTKLKNQKIQTEILEAKEFYNAEDYHQKYMLQHHPWLLESLDINPGDDLIQSHVAARLNGYIGGYGKTGDFNNEAPKLGLNEKMSEYVMRKMTSKY